MRRRRRRRRGRGSDWQTWWEDGMFGLSREPRGIRARWHHGDGKRGRQIRTIAGVSRTALSVMVVVLSLSPPSSPSAASLPRPPLYTHRRLCPRPHSFPPSRSSRSRGLPRFSLPLSLPLAIYKPPRRPRRGLILTERTSRPPLSTRPCM